MSNATPKLLRIDASARLEGSVSRRLADSVQAAWLGSHPKGVVIHRDLARSPIGHIEQKTIEGYYTPPENLTQELKAATALSDALIDEVKTAHTLLIAAPIYNFSIPSALKAWIDQIIRINHTFAYADGQFNGLATGPRAVMALAYGAGGYAGPLAQMDHLRPYLTQLLNFIGITSVEVIAAEATTTDQAEAQTQAALAQVPRLFPAMTD